MEAPPDIILCACVALVSAFLATFLLVKSCMRAKRRQRVAEAGVGGSAPSFARILRSGVRPLLPVAAALRRIGRVRCMSDDAADLCDSKGMTSSGESLLSVVLAASLLLGVVSLAVSQSVVCAVAVPLCALVLACAALGAAQDRRRDELRDGVPDALQAMGACFRTGLSLLQTFRQVSSEIKGPLSKKFARAAHRLETGRSVEESLAVFHEGASSSELAFVAVALEVQHESGGSMGQVLDAASETAAGEIELARSLRVQTAQARLSARVVSAMPFVLIALFSVISEGFLEPFFSSVAGLALLVVALGMQAAGILLVRRMLAVEVR